jgi:hypothetical protein
LRPKRDESARSDCPAWHDFAKRDVSGITLRNRQSAIGKALNWMNCPGQPDSFQIDPSTMNQAETSIFGGPRCFSSEGKVERRPPLVRG